MAKGWAGSAGLWWSLLFPCVICHIVPSGDFQPNCTTDFATELVCHWNVDDATSCSREVRLLYAQETQPYRNDIPLQSVCIPVNERWSDSTPQCTCSIPGKEFRWTRFSLALEVNGTRRGPVAFVDMEKHVKPRPLVNLTVDTKKSHSLVLTWKWNAVYTQENELRLSSPTYEVAYWPEGQRDEEKRVELTEQSYEIFTKQLSAGPYVASVRVKVRLFGDIWSEWSTPCKFHIESGNKLWLLVLWLCAVVMAVIFTFYLCFTRLKRSWWDHIPNPAKSKVTEDITSKPLSAVKKTHAVGEGKAPFSDRHDRGYENFPSAALLAPMTREKILRNGAGARLEAFLTPEVTLVESPLTICSHVAADKAEGPEREVLAEAVPHEDAMASLFMKILDGDFSAVEDTESLEQPPATGQASDRLLSGLHFLPETSLSSTAARESLEGSSKLGYRSSIVEAAPPWMVSAALEQQQGLSSPVPSLPQSPDAMCPSTTQGDGSNAQLSGYRCLGSLLFQPVTGPSQGWEPQLFSAKADQSQPRATDSGCSSLEAVFPGSSLWLSLLPAATALDFQLQQKAGPEATYQNVPRKPNAVSCPAVSPLSGYQSFNSALQNSTTDVQHDHNGLGLAPPYKPFLSVLRNSSPETPVGRVLLEPLLGAQEASGETWLGVLWGEDPDLRTLSTGIQVGTRGFEQEKGNVGRARSFLCP